MKLFTNLILFTLLLLPYFGCQKNHVKTEKKILAKKYYGKRRGGVRFRFYFGPRYRRGYYYRDYGYYYYYSQVSINVREDINAGEKVTDVSIDGYRLRLRPPSTSGNRGNYYYRLNPGYHYIEWTVVEPYGKSERYDYRFYVDRYNRYINISIDGDQIYIN